MSKNGIKLIFLISGSLFMTPGKPMAPFSSEYELMLQKLAEEDAYSPEDKKHLCFEFGVILGEHNLITRFDYAKAIQCLDQAKKNYEQLAHTAALKDKASSMYCMLAMAHHNIGQHEKRDENLARAKALLNIPDEISGYTSEMFSVNAGAYFIPYAFREYIFFEQSHKKSEPMERQEYHLLKAKEAFLKAEEICTFFHQKNRMLAYAMHGLGTIYEFLGKCAQKGTKKGVVGLFEISGNYFKQALALRKDNWGEAHLEVARSYHKLARNFMLLFGETQDTAYRDQSIFYYEQAIAIFEMNSIPQDQPKYLELKNEYLMLKK